MNAYTLLSKITGTETNESFGKPFISLFSDVFKEEKPENIEAVAFICALYISFFKEQFPLEKLRIFSTNIKEQCSLFYFDCKSYDALLGQLPEEPFKMYLIGRELKFKLVEVKKQDIYGALDFYTNQ